MNKTTRRLLALLVMAVLMGCHYEDFETDSSHHKFKSKTAEISFEEFKQGTQLYNFETKYKIPPGKNQYMQRDANGNYELSDFIVDTEKITRTIVGNDTTYAFILIPKEYAGDKEYYLTLYKELANWENSVIEKRKETQEDIYKEVFTTMARGTGCITIFSESIHCTKREGFCKPTCDRCSECATYRSYRLCGGSDGEEYNNPIFTEDPGGGGGGGGGTPPPPPDPEEPIVVLPEPEKKDECKKLEKLISNQAYKVKLDALTPKTIDPTNENGMTMNVDNEIVDFVPAPSIIINVNPIKKYVALGHVHNNSTNGTYSVFSYQDLRIFAEIIKNDKLEVDEFVATLSTSKGTHYAFTISNKQKFIDFFYYWTNSVTLTSTPEEKAKYFNSFNKADALEKKYYTNTDRLIKEDDTDNAKVRNLFLDFLKSADMGVTFYKTDATFQKFTKIYKDKTGTVKEESCN